MKPDPGLERVLVIRLGALGDVLHTMPAVRILAEAGAAVDFLTDPGASPLVEGQPDIRTTIRYDRRQADRGLTGLLRLARRLRAERYDAVVDLQGSARTRILAIATGARRRVRYRKDPPGTPRHAVDNFAATLVSLGLAAAGDGRGTTGRSAGRVPRFVPGAAAHRAAEAVLAAAGVPSGAHIVALHPGASHPVNRWRPERFGALAARLAGRPGLAVVLTGAAADRPLVDAAVRTATGAAGGESGAPSARGSAVPRQDGGGAADRPRLPVHDLAGQLDLPALGALLARCAVAVAADTGPLHLAAAVGTRTVGLFGAADPVRTGPLGDRHRVVRLGLDCVPCRARRCRRTDRVHACMEELTVEAVEAAVLAALAEAGWAPPGGRPGAPRRDGGGGGDAAGSQAPIPGSGG